MEKKTAQGGYNDFPLYVFHQGRNFKSQEFLGAHKVEDGKYVNSFEFYHNSYTTEEYFNIDKTPWIYGDNVQDENNQVEYDKITDTSISDLDVVLLPERFINVVKIKNK